MKRIVLVYGLIGGLIIFTLMTLNLLFVHNFDYGEVLGYSTMVIALSTVFIAIKQQRDKQLNGTINFGKAFLTGLYISLITSAFYVIGWMLISTVIMPDFCDKMVAAMATKMKADKSLNPAELVKKLKQVNDMKEMLKNPFVSSGIAFMEIFPVGLLITIISALLLKRKPREQAIS